MKELVHKMQEKNYYLCCILNSSKSRLRVRRNYTKKHKILWYIISTSCSFSRIIVLGSPLGPMIQDYKFWPLLLLKVGMIFKSNQKVLEYCWCYYLNIDHILFIIGYSLWLLAEFITGWDWRLFLSLCIIRPSTIKALQLSWSFQLSSCLILQALWLKNVVSLTIGS